MTVSYPTHLLTIPKHFKYVIVAFFLTLLSLRVNAQCPIGWGPDLPYFISRQIDIDNFIVDYPNCRELKVGLWISGEDITNLNGLNNLTEIDRDLWIWDNALLENLDGLNNLTEIGDLWIYRNEELKTLNGLNNLAQIRESLSIWANDQLENLNGLNNLTKIGGVLEIGYNKVLNNISALQNIDPATIIPIVIDDEIYGSSIISNPALSFCHLSNICSYLANDPETHPREIYGNAGACFDEQAVTYACLVSIDEFDTASFSIYPNPVDDILSITYSKAITSVEVMDLMGNTVIKSAVHSTGTQINMSSLIPGIYLVKVNAGDQVKIIKIMKQ